MMKKITQLSTLAIKLHDIFSFLSQNVVDISTISEKFKQHSQMLNKDVNLLLYNANNTDYKILFDKIRGEQNKFTPEIKPTDDIKAFEGETGENSFEKIDEYIEIMKNNFELSKKNGFEVLSGMHSILLDSLSLIKTGEVKTDKETIESLKACLIVIAAVVKGKEVNISEYLNKAGNFSKKINSIKSKELK
jgi:hypothetical protein